VVGAGLAGLACARAASRAGPVVLFDKGRKPGGRLNSKRTAFGPFELGGARLHGRDPAWARWLAELGGALAREGDGWTGVPRNVDVARGLERGLDIRCGAPVTGLARRSGRWSLDVGGAHVEADRVVLAVPAPQAVPLLVDAPALARALESVIYHPAWAAWVVAGADPPLRPTQVEDVLAEVRARAERPGRPAGPGWEVLASPEWSRAHLEDDAGAVGERLRDALGRRLGLDLRGASVGAHRWRYARVVNSLGLDFLADDRLGVFVCGDGCRGPDAGDAWVSGHRLGLHLAVGSQ